MIINGGLIGTYSRVTSDLAFSTPSLCCDADDVNWILPRNSTGFADVAAATPSLRHDRKGGLPCLLIEGGYESA